MSSLPYCSGIYFGSDSKLSFQLFPVISSYFQLYILTCVFHNLILRCTFSYTQLKGTGTRKRSRVEVIINFFIMKIKKTLSVLVILLMVLFGQQFTANASICTYCALEGTPQGICNCDPFGNDTCAWCVHTGGCDANCSSTEQCEQW